MKLYVYAKCSTCRNARKWLDARGIGYEEIAIRDQPPTKAELRRMAGYAGGVRKLFNTSGGDYRAMKLKERLGGMSDEDAIGLLAAHGNLVKRPFVIGKDFGVVGFRETEWEALLGSRFQRRDGGMG